MLGYLGHRKGLWVTMGHIPVSTFAFLSHELKGSWGVGDAGSRLYSITSGIPVHVSSRPRALAHLKEFQEHDA